MSGRSQPKTVAPPTDATIAPLYGGADLVDAYAIVLRAGTRADIGTLAERSFGGLPLWAGAAMMVRDGLMRWFGVKTARDIRDSLQRKGADRVGSFPVLARTEREIVLGEDDRHLDFRLSLMVRPCRDGAQEREFVATTVVQCHNRLGRAYLKTILLGHRLIVPAMLRGAISPRGTEAASA